MQRRMSTISYTSMADYDDYNTVDGFGARRCCERCINFDIDAHQCTSLDSVYCASSVSPHHYCECFEEAGDDYGV